MRLLNLRYIASREKVFKDEYGFCRTGILLEFQYTKELGQVKIWSWESHL